jgi:dihydrofolate reductase
MGKLFVSNLVSLDGYFADNQGGLGWFVLDDTFFHYVWEMLPQVGTIVFGRLTYELMAAFWPTESAKQTQPTTSAYMNGLPKVIFSRSLRSVDWENSRLATAPIGEEIKKLKEQSGEKDIVILGSGTIVTELTRQRLIDEYRLIVCPVIIGKGRPLFEGFEGRLPLRLIKTTRLGADQLILYYQPA